MRNPNRIVKFLDCLIPFENQILTSEIVMEVVGSVIREKLYTPMIVNRTPILKHTYKNDDEKYTENQIQFIVESSPQKHKEAGFAFGWESRFDTFYKLSMEFGFVSYAMGEPIKISETGHMLIDALHNENLDEEKIRMVFLNSMMKYQSDNPFRKNSNSNVPLILLLQVLKLLKEDSEENGAGVFRQELSLFICWPNNKAVELYNMVKRIRKSVGYTYSDEYMYEICMELLGASSAQKNRFKMKQICGEAVDEYIRKMRTTGIISLRGNGRFIDYNTWEHEKINYILENYSDYPKFVSKENYFEYMGAVDETIINMISDIPLDTTDIRKSALQKFAAEYQKEYVYNELRKVCTKLPSVDYMLKLLPGPVRLEFLVSVAMLQNLKNLNVLPNYAIDDEGLPTNTAAGGKADILCFDNKFRSLIEVTLMRGKQEQVTNEIVPIRRHLKEELEKHENTFSVFIAPIIHEDAREMAMWYKHKDNLDIMAYAMEEFIMKIKNESELAGLLMENRDGAN